MRSEVSREGRYTLSGRRCLEQNFQVKFVNFVKRENMFITFSLISTYFSLLNIYIKTISALTKLQLHSANEKKGLFYAFIAKKKEIVFCCKMLKIIYLCFTRKLSWKLF